MELFEIVMKLTGNVQPTGMHETDKIRLENLKKLTELTDRLLFEIHKCTGNEESQEYSVREIGRFALNFMKNVRDA